MKLILASASPRRLDLLNKAGVHPEVKPTDCDETITEKLTPRETTETLARRKAKAAAEAIGDPGAYVLAADTVVAAADGEILGKPKDDADARRMLRKLSGTRHFVLTGVCAIHGGETVSAVDETEVVFRPLTDAEVDAYVASGESRGKAGGYAIQETGDAFVLRIEGAWDNVVGLPVALADRLLGQLGAPLSEFE
ncbi:MAG: septum formation protein Maf [Clostridia bacterium]|nr:septum formation protein Maf [Clostridia bacterium]